MDVEIRKEILTREVQDELQPLLNMHWEEVELNGEEFNLDWPAYVALQDAGLFHFYVMRLGGAIIGYMGYIVAPNLRLLGTKYAFCDLIYVSPDCRGKMYGAKLLKFAEADIKSEDVYTIGQSVKAHHNFGRMLERQGYHLEEYYYSKRVQ
jgi:GNAT superfamily N-acetyltransferase